MGPRHAEEFGGTRYDRLDRRIETFALNLPQQKEYVNDITNELYLDVAAHLANRVHGRARQSYVDQAKDEWQWFQESGMINSGNFVNDGLTNDTCENNGRTTWSYNQGVILGGLTELYRATGDDAYIEAAKPIADAAIKGLIDENGILHDDCEPDCDDDGSQVRCSLGSSIPQAQPTNKPPQHSSKASLHAISRSCTRRALSRGTTSSSTATPTAFGRMTAKATS